MAGLKDPASIAPSLRGRVALVTGAGRGIGRAHALCLAAAGAAVVVNDAGRGIDGLGATQPVASSVASEIAEAGGECRIDTTDISTFDGAEEAIGQAYRWYGRLDVLINNAGILGGDDLEELAQSDLDRLFAVHVTGTLGTMRAALPAMREQMWGRVVNTVSEVALTPGVGAAAPVYGAAKAAVWSATLAAATAYAGSGVTVNALSPGARTRMSETAIDRSSSAQALDLDPFHVARVACYLASDAAADVSGRIIHVAGGHIREYLPVQRTAETTLVHRLGAVLQPDGHTSPRSPHSPTLSTQRDWYGSVDIASNGR